MESKIENFNLDFQRPGINYSPLRSRRGTGILSIPRNPCPLDWLRSKRSLALHRSFPVGKSCAEFLRFEEGNEIEGSHRIGE